MPYVVKPIDRNQLAMTNIDCMVDAESLSRVIDCFVDHLDLKAMGFERIAPSIEGRPEYDPKSMLKIYLYGYRNKIRSSRRLARACEVDIEVMWMTGGLRPDFRTISDFRKNNAEHLHEVFREFTRRVSVDLKTGYVSIDGTKILSQNAKDRNFTITKLDERIQWMQDRSKEYLRQIEIIDKKEDEEMAEAEAEANGMLTKEILEKKLQELQERTERYKGYQEMMEREKLTQISLTDADARLMKNHNEMEVCYNVQTAVDSETHLIVDYLATNQVTDHGLMSATMEGLKAEQEVQTIMEAVGDKGYNKSEDMVKCLEEGIVPHVILPDGKDNYEIEVAYEEAEGANPDSTKAEDLKKCIHSGVIPNAYKDVIPEMEVVEVNRRVYDEPETDATKVQNPYGTEEEMRSRAAEGHYVRDPERDLVYCPNGSILRPKRILANGSTRYANKQACKQCPLRNKCIGGRGLSKGKELDYAKDVLEKPAKWMNTEQSEVSEEPAKQGHKRKTHFEKIKVVRFKLRPDRKKMDQRKCLSEHPFGTIKRTLGAAYFNLRSKIKISGEFALLAFSYNLVRAKNLLGFGRLMQLVEG